MLGGGLPAERLELAPVDGASVTLRTVTAEDQARWRDKRKSRMTGYGALGDKGDLRERSYVYLPIPEWLLDCCTACVEVSRSVDLTVMPPDDELTEAAFRATGANALDFACTAAVDLLRLLPVPTSIQVPVTELVVVATDGHYSRNHRAWSTPGFRWQFAQQRWELSDADMNAVADRWRSLVTGPNQDALRWPLRRFGLAQQRPFAEDRLVDLAIAAEAIFARENDPIKGTSTRIAKRANHLLNGNRLATKVRGKRIVDAYATRSAVVHGRLPSEEEVEGAASALETVIRDALRALLSVTTHIDPVAPGLPVPATRSSMSPAVASSIQKGRSESITTAAVEYD